MRTHARACVCIWAFVHESQTLRVTDNSTQGMHYDYVGAGCWAYTSEDSPRNSLQLTSSM